MCDQFLHWRSSWSSTHGVVGYGFRYRWRYITVFCIAIAHLIVGRVICGIGTGIDSSTVPVYQSELCEKERHGRLVSWEVLFIGVDVVIAVRFPDILMRSQLLNLL